MNENKKSIQVLITDKSAKDLLEIFDYMETNVFDADWMEEEKTVSDLRPILKECADIFDIKKTSFKQKNIVRFEGITKQGKNILSYLINNLNINAIELSIADSIDLTNQINKEYSVLIQLEEID